MKPGFALSLSFEGISLLRRSAGGWRRVGNAEPFSPTLAEDLAKLRAVADAQADDGITTKLIIPNDQIRYLAVPAPDGPVDDAARLALDGQTPYALNELVVDTRLDGETLHIAAVARETLEEAEAFAVEHAFDPLGFVAVPGDTPFPGEPFFGPTRHAQTLLDPGETVERDDAAVVVVGLFEKPAAPVMAPPDPQVPTPQSTDSEPDAAEPQTQPDEPPPPPSQAMPEDNSADDPVGTGAVGVADAALPPADDASEADAPADDTPAPGFASRRARNGDDAIPALSGVTRATVPSPAIPETVAEPEPVAEPILSITDIDDLPDWQPPRTGQRADPPAPQASESPMAEPARSAAGAATKAISGFLSRRRAMARKTAKPAVREPVPPLPAHPPAPLPHAASVDALDPDDEATRMTVFGARQGTAAVGGKPRHLGLMMTAGLLLFLAVVAVWASLFMDDGLAGFLGGPDDTEIAAQSPTVAPAEPERETITQEEPIDLASVEPGGSDLTDADAAVLEALREPDAPTEPEVIDEVETEARYAATGIWQEAPVAPEPSPALGAEDIYVASVDRSDLSQDPVALPPQPGLPSDLPLDAIASPPPAGTKFVLDERGLIIPTSAGSLTPEGFTVFLGKPPAIPPATPTRFDSPPEEEAEIIAGLPDRRPRLRPTGLVERSERTQLGGRTREELSGVRPRPRPRTIKEEAEVDETPTAQAIARSRVPSPRPRNFARRVEKQLTSPNRAPDQPSRGSGSNGRQVASVAPRTVKPRIPSAASVARSATVRNAINLRRVNLIGVYGTPSNRRALVRLSSGRYKKVKVGDSIDGGRISAIGDSELRYEKGGRNLVLKIPSG